MSERKEKIIADLQKAKDEGSLRAEKIREIVKNAVSQTTEEVKTGSLEIRTLVQDVVSAVVEFFQEKGGEIKEEITASIQGAIEGISSLRRKAISQNQSQIQQLEGKIEDEQTQIQQEIDTVLDSLEETGKTQTIDVKKAIESATNTIKDSEELALLQKRYAQLKAQLAIVQANLSERYGEQIEDVKKYLDDAQKWYDRAKEQPHVFTDKVEQKRTEFETKLGEAGTAIAKKEREIKNILQELWHSLSEIFRDKDKQDK